MRNIAEITRKFFWKGVFMWFFAVGSIGAQEGTVDTFPPGFELPSPLNVTGGIMGLVNVILNDVVLPLGTIAAALAIIYSGFLYVKAQGNKSELEKAHEAIKWTIVGTAVILGSWALAQLIGGTIEALRAP